MVGKIEVFNGLEDGLLGITLDPNFNENNHLYLFRSPPNRSGACESQAAQGFNLVSRFTLNDGNLDLVSEKELIRIKTQRDNVANSVDR